MVIVVKDHVDAADTADQGSVLFPILAAEVNSGCGEIVVSFEGISTATSSFVNASFVNLLGTISVSEIKRRFRVVRSTAQINDMIRRRLDQETLQNA